MPQRENRLFLLTAAAQFLHHYSPPIRSLQLGVILGLMHIQFANPIFTSNDLRPAQLSLYCQCCGTTVSLCICASNWLFQNNHSSQKVAVGQQHPSLIVPAAVKCPVFLCSFTFRVVSNKSTCLSKKSSEACPIRDSRVTQMLEDNVSLSLSALFLCSSLWTF